MSACSSAGRVSRVSRVKAPYARLAALLALSGSSWRRSCTSWLVYMWHLRNAAVSAAEMALEMQQQTYVCLCAVSQAVVSVAYTTMHSSSSSSAGLAADTACDRCSRCTEVRACSCHLGSTLPLLSALVVPQGMRQTMAVVALKQWCLMTVSVIEQPASCPPAPCVCAPCQAYHHVTTTPAWQHLCSVVSADCAGGQRKSQAGEMCAHCWCMLIGMSERILL
jgi:hypothetical protein